MRATRQIAAECRVVTEAAEAEAEAAAPARQRRLRDAAAHADELAALRGEVVRKMMMMMTALRVRIRVPAVSL